MHFVQLKKNLAKKVRRIDKQIERKTEQYEALFQTVNKILSVILMLISLYILSAPLLPELTYALAASERSHAEEHQPSELKNSEGERIISLFDEHQKNQKFAEDDFYLFIPSIGIYGTVHEGETAETLSKGFWHIPTSNTPDQGGNTVIVAHRFMYTSGPNTFYHLNKLTPGEYIVVAHKDKEYVYKSESLFEVTPDQVDIEADSEDPILTLYTCTPIWTSTHRLVVQAKLVYTRDVRQKQVNL